MENNTDKLIQDQFNSLPADVKEAISRVPWKARVQDIAKREGLNAEQSTSLETETMLTLYGFVAPDSYIGNITTEVGVEEEQAERISKLVTDEIIADIEKQFEMIDALMPKDDTPKESGPAPAAPKEEKKPEPDKGLLDISPEILAKQVKMPEIAPDMLPEVLPGQTAHDVPHVEAPAPIAVSAPAPASESTAVPAPVVEAPSPAPAPKIEIVPAPEVPPAPKSIVEEKLSQVTSAPIQSPASTAPAVPSYEPGKDPYREPIE